jgi:hypothetical protein
MVGWLRSRAKLRCRSMPLDRHSRRQVLGYRPFSLFAEAAGCSGISGPFYFCVHAAYCTEIDLVRICGPHARHFLGACRVPAEIDGRKRENGLLANGFEHFHAVAFGVFDV